MKIINTQTKVYNEVKRTYIGNEDLKEGQGFCDKCEGIGCSKYKGFDYMQSLCNKCQGEGVLDWIEKVVGKAPNPTGLYSTSSNFGPDGIQGPDGISETSGLK